MNVYTRVLCYNNTYKCVIYNGGHEMRTHILYSYLTSAVSLYYILAKMCTGIEFDLRVKVAFVEQVRINISKHLNAYDVYIIMR